MAKKTENQSEPTDLATIPPANQNVNEFFAGMGDELKGIYEASDENVSNSEIQVSRLGIVQPTSPEVTGQVEGWKAGMLYDNVCRTVISQPMKQPWLQFKGVEPSQLKTVDCLIFLPIFKLPTEFVKWPTKEERQNGLKAFHWKTLDGTDEKVREGMWRPKGTWQGKGSPPVTEHLNIVGCAVDFDGVVSGMPIVLSFSRTSYPTGKRFVTACQNLKLRNLPWWAVPQYLYCDKITNPRNETYFVLRFAGSALIHQVFETEVAKELHNGCKKLAMELADPNTGRDFQEALINAASISGDETGEGDAGSVNGEGEGSADFATDKF